MSKWLALVTAVAVVIITGAALGFQSEGWVFERGHSPEFPLEKPDPTGGKPSGPTTSTSLKQETVDEDPVSTVTSSDEEAPKAESTPVDTTPPGLVILHPVEGQVFEKKEVVFEGTTETGAKVFAGNYEADVKDDGSWRIVLILSPGGNHATLRAEDQAGNVSKASVTVYLEPPAKDDQSEQPKEETDEAKEKEDQGESEEAEWHFEAHQVFGECSETPPYDIFYGHGLPGGTIFVVSEYGSGTTLVNDQGEWEIKVFFEGAPVGKGFAVKVKDEFGNHQVFEFTRTG
ncbi:MAG TPA: hypothetical protein VJR05_12265 [Acidimicrobiia bacterium]|nr:hypothetical protein [Acidimicrobiia bacterium]